MDILEPKCFYWLWWTSPGAKQEHFEKHLWYQAVILVCFLEEICPGTLLICIFVTKSKFLFYSVKQGNRRYIPLHQLTTQQVMIKTISAGPTTVILIGSHTNFAIFLMTYPHLKRNVEHIYIMGGGVRSKNPTGCCPKNDTTSCTPQQCGDIGNLFTSYSTNPNAEFNIFGDPFAAYQVYVLHFKEAVYSTLFLVKLSKRNYLISYTYVSLNLHPCSLSPLLYNSIPPKE
jgi:hypothetical protein